LGLEIDTAELRRAEDISPAFDAFKSRVQALYVCADALVNTNNVRINILIFGVPTFFVDNEMFFGNDRLDFVRERLAAHSQDTLA
jgi:2-hydroxychromene-2-carboxylate isomerase